VEVWERHGLLKPVGDLAAVATEGECELAEIREQIGDAEALGGDPIGSFVGRGGDGNVGEPNLRGVESTREGGQTVCEKASEGRGRRERALTCGQEAATRQRWGRL
jgi:hypothetical protein